MSFYVSEQVQSDIQLKRSYLFQMFPSALA